MKKECIAMLLAGGQGSRLYVLTENMAKPAVPFGGKFRIIDFPLSNCANSGIDTIGVLTQYRPLELNRYIGNGQPWDLDRSDGGVHILPPYQSAKGATWFKGTANAIYQNIGFVDMYDPDYVLILSGDHIYKMDYAAMLAHHKRVHADCTIAVMEVPWDEASRFGIMNVDGEDTITEFEEKPKQPRSNLASMGIYVFSWRKLRAYLIADENDADIRMADHVDVPYELLAQGKMDAILVSPQDEGQYEWVHLADDPMFAVLPKDFDTQGMTAFPLAAFEARDFIMPSQGFDKDIMRIFNRIGVKPHILPTWVDDPTVISMVSHGLGVSMMTELTVRGRTDGVKLLPVEPASSRELGLAVRSLDAASDGLRHFIDCTKRVVAEMQP